MPVKPSDHPTSLVKLLLSLVGDERSSQALAAGIIGVIAASALFSIGAPVLFAIGIDRLTSQRYNSDGLHLLIAFASGVTIAAIITQFQWLTYGPLGLTLQRSLSLKMFRHIINMPFTTFERQTIAGISHSLEKSLTALQTIMYNVTFSILPNVLEITASILILVWKIDLITAIAIGVSLLLYAIVTFHSARQIKQATYVAFKSSSEAWRLGIDGLTSVRQLRTYDSADFFLNQLESKNIQADMLWMSTFKIRMKAGVLQATVFGACSTIVLYHAATLFRGGILSIGDIVLLNAYLARLLQPVSSFATALREVQAATVQAADLISLLREPVERRLNGLDLEALPSGPVGVEFQDVTYNRSNQAILRSASFSVKPGERVLILGPSGAGKTTLLKLIACLAEPESGSVRLSGISSINISLKGLYGKMGFVEQECILFDTNIITNISFGRVIKDDHVIKLCKDLKLDDVIARLGSSADKTVGERGSQTSGGERQRISLARALAGVPKILLLDEPTSSIDPMNRVRVIDLLTHPGRDCTVIIVSHDVSISEHMDKVIFLPGNGDVEVGTHELLKKSSKKYNLFCSSHGQEGLTINTVEEPVFAGSPPV